MGTAARVFASLAVHTSGHGNNGRCIQFEPVLLELFQWFRKPDNADYVFAAEQEKDILPGLTCIRKDLRTVRRWTGG